MSKCHIVGNHMSWLMLSLPDAAIQADIERMRGPVQSWITNVVGSTAVTIDGDCRHKECNSGKK